MGLSMEEGPSIVADDHFNAQGYDKIEAVIPKSSVPTTINVQPSLLTELQAIMIIADVYTDLTYTVDEGVTPITLDAPLLLVGPGNIALLGATVNDITFTNANATTARNVTILVARTAIEPEGN
jgi:hypothetical protein